MIMYRVSTKRAARGRLRQPYRQGDLDGLCGVYSAVNAVRALCPEVDDDAASCIFEALLLALPKVDADPAATVSWGVGRRQLEHLLKKAIGYVGDELDIRLTATHPPRHGSGWVGVDLGQRQQQGFENAAGRVVVDLGAQGPHGVDSAVDPAEAVEITLPVGLAQPPSGGPPC